MTAAHTSAGRLFISQADNHAGNFGEVLRSSAIFWVKNSDSIRSTVSVCNYWQFKNSLTVRVVLSLRHMSGKLVTRIPVDFATGSVVNYSPPDGFEGSVEIEAFGNVNLRIPYAAVMVVYEASDSITMVHSYARAYCWHEIEEGRTITVGEESCWSLNDSATASSFCVFHNGAASQEAQDITLRVRNASGQERTTRFRLAALAPYQTVIIEPVRYFPDLVEWLMGQPGNGRLSFRLNGGFTRMLCGTSKHDGSQLQVTHSNFDYSAHETDNITGAINQAWMLTPAVPAPFTQQILVYPDMSTGRYVMSGEGVSLAFGAGSITQVAFDSGRPLKLEFSRIDGQLPTRIVTGIRLTRDAATLPAECSLGVKHGNCPKKHFAWMLVSTRFNSSICWTDLAEFFGGCPQAATLVFNLHGTRHQSPFTRTLAYADMPVEHRIRVQDLFAGQLGIEDDYCYVSVWCSYGGLTFFSTLEKADSITLEHSF